MWWFCLFACSLTLVWVLWSSGMNLKRSRLRQMWNFTSVLNFFDNIIICLCWTAPRFVARTHDVTVKNNLILSMDHLHLGSRRSYGGCLVFKDLWALWCRLASIVAILSKQGCTCWTVQICMFWILAVDIKRFFLVYWVYLWIWEMWKWRNWKWSFWSVLICTASLVLHHDPATYQIVVLLVYLSLNELKFGFDVNFSNIDRRHKISVFISAYLSKEWWKQLHISTGRHCNFQIYSNFTVYLTGYTWW